MIHIQMIKVERIRPGSRAFYRIKHIHNNGFQKGSDKVKPETLIFPGGTDTFIRKCGLVVLEWVGIAV